MDEPKTTEDGFSFNEVPNPHAFIQWKGTNVCMDFHCKCGAHCHFDGDFSYTVKCPHCDTVWEMPFNLFPREAEERTMEYWRKNPKILEPDEDMVPKMADTAESITTLPALEPYAEPWHVAEARRVYQTITAFGWEVTWKSQNPVPDDAWPIDIIAKAIRESAGRRGPTAASRARA